MNLIPDFIPIWLLLALLAVFGKTTYYILQKKLLDEDSASSSELGYVTAIYGLVLLSPFFFYKLFFEGLSISIVNVLIIACLGLLELFGLLVYLRALKETQISIASPIKKAKPVLISVIEPIILSISFSPVIVVASSLTGVGGFLVLAEDLNWKSLRERLSERGPKLAIGAMIIYALLSLGSRFGNSTVGPIVFGFIVFSVMTVGYYGMLKRKSVSPPKSELISRDYVLVGITGVLRSVLVWGAYALASATVVSSVTQLTILLDVIIGGTLFNEGDLRKKIVGSVMILIGVLVVIFY
jgi:drug/metabolite transporter (DMT)-like permease